MSVIRRWLEKLGWWMYRTGDRMEKENEWSPPDLQDTPEDERREQ